MDVKVFDQRAWIPAGADGIAGRGATAESARWCRECGMSYLSNRPGSADTEGMIQTPSNDRAGHLRDHDRVGREGPVADVAIGGHGE